VFPAAVVTTAEAVACELPATRGVPVSRWSLAELRDELVACGVVTQISTTTLWRWLAEDPIKPWQHRSWIFPRDPAFAAKAGVVLDLYQRCFEGRPSARTSTSSAPTRRPRSKPVTAATRPCRPALPGRCESSTSTTVVGRLPTWPHGTSTGHGCSAVASRRLASGRSAGW
jgi:hypothetical protein